MGLYSRFDVIVSVCGKGERRVPWGKAVGVRIGRGLSVDQKDLYEWRGGSICGSGARLRG